MSVRSKASTPMKIARLEFERIKDGREGWYLMVGKYAVRFIEDEETANMHLRVFTRESDAVIKRRLRAMKRKP